LTAQGAGAACADVVLVGVLVGVLVSESVGVVVSVVGVLVSVAGMGVLDTVESPELQAASAAAVTASRQPTTADAGRFLTPQQATGSLPDRHVATRVGIRLGPQ